MNNGDLSGAIDYFVKANEQDGKENANVSGLLMLGNAYEANGELDKAEEVYAYLYTDIVPSASDAYRNQVRIYLAQGREKEAAELLAVAYKATGVTSFNTSARPSCRRRPARALQRVTTPPSRRLPLPWRRIMTCTTRSTT